MYKCVSFYTDNRMLQEGQSAVIAAWSVVADETYHYDMKVDELGYPRALCFIRTIEGRGRIQTEEGEILLSEKEYILLNRRDIRYYSAAAKLWAYYWVDFLWVEKEPVAIGRKRFAPLKKKSACCLKSFCRWGVLIRRNCGISTAFLSTIFTICGSRIIRLKKMRGNRS